MSAIAPGLVAEFVAAIRSYRYVPAQPILDRMGGTLEEAAGLAAEQTVRDLRRLADRRRPRAG
jgi:hypothetical protein